MIIYYLKAKLLGFLSIMTNYLIRMFSFDFWIANIAKVAKQHINLFIVDWFAFK